MITTDGLSCIGRAKILAFYKPNSTTNRPPPKSLRLAQYTAHDNQYSFYSIDSYYILFYYGIFDYGIFDYNLDEHIPRVLFVSYQNISSDYERMLHP
ncbi:MAG: hypothetical protein ACPGC9_02245 [Cytophagales bacterium]